MGRGRWRYRKLFRKRYGRIIWLVIKRNGKKGFFKFPVQKKQRREHRILVANEYIAAALAKSVGLPVAKVKQVTVRGPRGIRRRGLLSQKASANKVIPWKKAKKRVHRKPQKKVKKGDMLARIVAFDAWIMNPDRNNRNLILYRKKSAKHYKWYLIDHGIAVFGKPSRWSLRKAKRKFRKKKAYKFTMHSGSKKKQRIPKGLKRFTLDNRKSFDKMVKKIKKLPNSVIRKAVKKVPKGCLRRAERKFITKLLIHRKKQIKKIVKRISKRFK
ncbi:HipA family kinase [Brevibacillus reuszeri]|uniref:HipA family kinase n=1 Tax=Brevibacillus reuszeri TaxID=54915 RepID=UPI00289B38CB|nr:HipA family kinase [Brevibacillus reuszeri]